MFEMRPEHIQAFDAAQLKNFEERAIAHARRTLPNETENMSDTQLQASFRREMPKSQSYGLVTERQILRFFDAALMLGEGFDQDRRMPWAREILLDTKSDPDVRARTLVHKAAQASGYEVVK